MATNVPVPTLRRGRGREQSMSMYFDDIFKIILVGDAAVGKSALIERFCSDGFDVEHNPTLAVYLKTRVIQLGDRRVKLQLWDTAGADRFRSFTSLYCRGAMGIIFVFDVGSQKSFNSLSNWIKLVEKTEDCQDFIPEKIIVGNKEDQASAREVNKDEARLLAIKSKMKYVETSAKTGFNVMELFYNFSRDIELLREKERDKRLAKYNSNIPQVKKVAPPTPPQEKFEMKEKGQDEVPTEEPMKSNCFPNCFKVPDRTWRCAIL